MCIDGRVVSGSSGSYGYNIWIKRDLEKLVLSGAIWPNFKCLTTETENEKEKRKWREGTDRGL